MSDYSESDYSHHTTWEYQKGVSDSYRVGWERIFGSDNVGSDNVSAGSVDEVIDEEE